MENKLIINICASKDQFGAYSANCEGIFAAGNTLEACKKDVETAIRLIKQEQPIDQWPSPIKQAYTIEYHYDTQSLLLHYGTLLHSQDLNASQASIKNNFGPTCTDEAPPAKPKKNA